MISPLRSAKVIRLALVPILVLWVAGAGCLFGCGNNTQAAAIAAGAHAHHSMTQIASGHACPSKKSHACCAKNQASSQQQGMKPTETEFPAVLRQRTGKMMDCPLAVNANALSTKARTDEGTVLANQHALLLEREAPDQLNPLFPPAVLPNHGHSYLRCCVFLI